MVWINTVRTVEIPQIVLINSYIAYTHYSLCLTILHTPREWLDDLTRELRFAQCLARTSASSFTDLQLYFHTVGQSSPWEVFVACFTFGYQKVKIPLSSAHTESLKINKSILRGQVEGAVCPPVQLYKASLWGTYWTVSLQSHCWYVQLRYVSIYLKDFSCNSLLAESVSLQLSVNLTVQSGDCWGTSPFKRRWPLW